MTENPLNRPVWYALTTRQSDLALGGPKAVRLDPDHGLFAASADLSAQSLAALTPLLPADGPMWIVETEPVAAPPGAQVVQHADVWQMVATDLSPDAPRNVEIVPLTDADAPRMRTLADLTEPGPFLASTHRLGEFIGVVRDGVLAAMAGERLKPAGFTEVSGVCTHPDHRGQGYAAVLTHAVARKIQDRGETPFLHVYAGNIGAIRVYEALGFTLRRVMVLTVLARAGAAVSPPTGHGPAAG